MESNSIQLGRMDSKENEAKFNSQAIQSYSNAIQTMINNQNVGVKIADLGNACYDVSTAGLSSQIYLRVYLSK